MTMILVLAVLFADTILRYKNYVLYIMHITIHDLASVDMCNTLVIINYAKLFQSQVVWATTNKVGCGAKRCATVENLPGFLNALLVVCNYAPGWVR